MLEPTRTTYKTLEELNNREKAAIVLIAMGKDVTAQVLRHMPEAEIESLSTEIARMANVNPKTEMDVLKEYYSMMQASEYINEGGFDFARDVLEASLGKSRAENILKKIQMRSIRADSRCSRMWIPPIFSNS